MVVNPDCVASERSRVKHQKHQKHTWKRRRGKRRHMTHILRIDGGAGSNCDDTGSRVEMDCDYHADPVQARSRRQEEIGSVISQEQFY